MFKTKIWGHKIWEGTAPECPRGYGPDWRQTHEDITEKDRQKNACEKQKANDFLQNY